MYRATQWCACVRVCAHNCSASCAVLWGDCEANESMEVSCGYEQPSARAGTSTQPQRFLYCAVG
jgi:hypothetical protein